MIVKFDKNVFLDTAQTVFRSKGIVGSSLADVAIAAQMSEDDVANHYSDLGKVVYDLLDRENSAVSQLHIDIMNAQGRPDTRLKKLIREVIIRASRSYILETFSTSGIVQRTDDYAFMAQVNDVVKDYRKQNTAIIARLIAQGQADGTFSQFDPMEGAFLLRGMMHAAIFYREKPCLTEEEAIEHADFLIRTFFKGTVR